MPYIENTPIDIKLCLSQRIFDQTQKISDEKHKGHDKMGKKPYHATAPYTAKNQYRKFETNIPRKGIARPHSPNFQMDVSVSDLYLPILLQEICGPTLGIYNLLTDTLMWKLRPRQRNSQKRNT